MMKLKMIPTLLGFVFVFSNCRSGAIHEAQSNGASPASAKASDKPTETPASEAAVNSKIQEYFQVLYPKGSTKTFDDAKFDDRAAKEGFLKVTGNFEGYYVFQLLPGETLDYVIEQKTGCGHECTQKFKVRVFSRGKLVKTQTLEDLYPRKQVVTHVRNMQSALPATSSGDILESWMRLSKKSAAVDVLLLDQNPGAATGPARVYQIGQLTWNGKSFDFNSSSPKTPSKIPISEVW